MFQGKRKIAAAGVLCALVAAGAWAQGKKAVGEEIEGQIRRASFQYYLNTVLGDAEEYLKATRMPLYVVRDGVVATRDEKATRALLTKFAERFKAAKYSDEDRKHIVTNMIALFDEASIQFIGANTATLTFLISLRKEEGKGDSMATLTLHRKDGKWQVIAEATDSAPVPPEYLK